MRIISIATIFGLFLPNSLAGYLQRDEEKYLRNFEAHMANSYSEGDLASSLNSCRASPGFIVGGQITVRPTSIISGDGRTTVTSGQVQEQCHEAYLCVIPRNMTVEMTTSLHVGALQIQGEFKWTDESQSQEEIHLCAGYVAIEGSFTMNLQSKKAWIYLLANGAHHDVLGWRGFGGVGSTMVQITGRPLQRTWTLLGRPLLSGSTTMQLLHDPAAMGWQVGDRVAVAPTEMQSKGTGQAFTIAHLSADGTVILDRPSSYDHKADFLSSRMPDSIPPILMSAEVLNLSRNIVVTGDDFENIPCDPNLDDETKGCVCTDYRKTCTLGLHTVMVRTGTLRISNIRVEKCGQRGILGRYCLHFHRLENCPDCLLSGNAIESGQQRGIVVHGTHRALVQRNVLWNVRGTGIYVEDGNEMYNSFEYNVVVCPFPLDDLAQHGCTIPGTTKGSIDDRQNQAGFYLRSTTNDLIGNRAANSRNGMFAEAGMDGGARGQVCAQQTTIGRWEGNTFHGHARFGTYPIRLYPQTTDRSVETNGFNLDRSLCKGFDSKGETNGMAAAIVNHVDYDNIFVGQYEMGNLQYRGHVSLNNKNLIYWKETTNFEDGCGAHISESYYANGNLALPDQATIILQDMVMENVSLEANHHCQVGSTGYLCMPQYILHNIDWRHQDSASKWMYFQRGATNYGGIFTLSPTSRKGNSPFPNGFTSLVSDRFDYLLDEPNNQCESSYHLGFGERFDNGILCKVPLRALKVYTKGLKYSDITPSLRVEVWFNNKDGIAAHSERRPTTSQLYPFHRIGNNEISERQGFAFPVIPAPDVSYRLSLSGDDRDIPDDWVIEFSDPVVGNRWGEEYLQLELRGRPCADDGVVSSHHDRRFIYSGGEYMPNGEAWGKHGACMKESKMPTSQCDAGGNIEATSCPELCESICDSSNSYCDCRTASCRCKVGFMGDDCSIDLCSDSCGSTGTCAGLYLGSTLPIHFTDHQCIGDELRKRQLQESSEISQSAKPTEILLLLAIIGLGATINMIMI